MAYLKVNCIKANTLYKVGELFHLEDSPVGRIIEVSDSSIILDLFHQMGYDPKGERYIFNDNNKCYPSKDINKFIKKKKNYG